MLLLHAAYLLAQALVHQAQRIGRRRGGRAVVNGVGGEEQILAAQVIVEPRGAEVLPYVLRGMAERLRDAAAQVWPVLGCVDTHVRLPSRRVGQIALPRLVIGNQRHRAQPPVLPEAFVVAEEKQLVLLHRAAQRRAKLVALELRNRRLVKVVARIESAVAQKFKYRAMQTVGAGGGHDAHLRAVALAVAGAVGVCHHVELAYRIHSQQLAAGAARRHVDQRCACVLNAVQQKQIILWTPPAD